MYTAILAVPLLRKSRSHVVAWLRSNLVSRVGLHLISRHFITITSNYSMLHQTSLFFGGLLKKRLPCVRRLQRAPHEIFLKASQLPPAIAPVVSRIKPHGLAQDNLSLEFILKSPEAHSRAVICKTYGQLLRYRTPPASGSNTCFDQYGRCEW